MQGGQGGRAAKNPGEGIRVQAHACMHAGMHPYAMNPHTHKCHMLAWKKLVLCSSTMKKKRNTLLLWLQCRSAHVAGYVERAAVAGRGTHSRSWHAAAGQ